MSKKQAGGCPAVLRSKKNGSRAVWLANESAGADFALIGFANACEMAEDGWTIIPYGEWPHSEGVQRFTQQSAEKIVGAFKSTWGAFKRAVIGLPVFKGHPDLTGLENQYPDKAEYGQVADMEARPEGLAVKQILSAGGAALVRSGLRFISPHWLANAVGKTASGATIYEPVLMKSVGLTNRPNIPNKSLVNTAEKSMKPELWLALIQLLGLKPIANAAEVTGEQVNEAVTALAARPTPEALANEKTAVVTLTDRAQRAETELAKVKTDLTTAATALANEKKTKIDETLNGAVKAGVITEADRPVWAKRLDRDFEGESVALVNCNPAIKVKPTVEQLRLAAMDKKLKNKDGTEIANEGEDMNIGALVNAEMASPSCANIKSPTTKYNTAFANVARKHPALFTEKAAS